MTTRYVALLRGINVSGQKKMRMADLRRLLEEAGFAEVATYIQSGNVVLSSEASADGVAASVRRAIADAYGFDVPVAVRSATELASVVSSVPFDRQRMDGDKKRHLVAFLDREAPADAAARLAPYLATADEVAAHGRELYVYLPNGQAKSKFSNAVIEKQLECTSTMRNWKTVKVLLEMSR